MSSPVYDYARSMEYDGEVKLGSTPERHYEFDVENEETYWEPASREDELKMQLQKLGVREIAEDSFE